MEEMEGTSSQGHSKKSGVSFCIFLVCMPCRAAGGAFSIGTSARYRGIYALHGLDVLD